MGRQTKEFSVIFKGELETSQIKSSVAAMQAQFEKLNPSQSLSTKFNKLFNNLLEAVNDFEAKSSHALESLGDVDALERDGKRVQRLYSSLQKEIKALGNLSDKEFAKLFPDALTNDSKKAAKAVQDFSRSINTSTQNLAKYKKELSKAEEDLIGYKNAQEALAKSAKEKTVVSDADFAEAKKGLEALNKQYDTQEKKLAKLQAGLSGYLNSIKEQYGDKAVTKDGNINKSYKSLVSSAQPEIDKQNKAINEARNLLNGYHRSIVETTSAMANMIAQSEFDQIAAEIGKTESEITELNNKIDTTEAEIDEAYNALKKFFSELTGQDFSEFENGEATIKAMVDAVRKFDPTEVQQIDAAIENMSNSAEECGKAVGEMNTKLDQTSSTTKDLHSAASEVENLRNQVAQFFSIDNTVQLFKRAVQSAYKTVKELDKAMTETAVVTDFSVGDMWESLPKYTQVANELGATTLGAYETMTLFYQQGLETNEVFEIGTETMKMARIAGMEYADATNMMTAALRGFNMELNETSARRVNDVYSELAAITASDTEEIAVAMTKTASIANSANMQFETTAAFLSQIIETTREAPETAGTAMKTIIARFAEVTKMVEGGIDIGVDEEGEEININKIDKALKSAGISLKDFIQGNEGLDEVFLRLAEKWDSLDVYTQRYIATVAAGSRQQSRFIAMMSDYDRTIELTQAANDSAGASNTQFQKTTESLETALNNLSNAWNEFTMGIANNEIIRGVINILTDILTVVNNITGALPGAAGGVAKLLLAFGALRVGKAIFDKLFSTIALSFRQAGDKSSKSFGEGLKQGFKKVTSSKNLFTIPPGFVKKFSTQFASSLQKNIDSATNKIDVNGLYKTFEEVYKTLDNPAAFKNLIKAAPQAGQIITNAFRNAAVEAKVPLDVIEANIKELDAAWQSGNMTVFFQKLKEYLRQAGINLEFTEQQIKDINAEFGKTKGIQTYINAFTTLGGVMTSVGGLCHMLASAFEEAGNTKAAENWRDAGNILMGVGTAVITVTQLFNVLAPAIQKSTVAMAAFKAILTALQGPLGIILAVGAIIVAVAIGIAAAIETPAEKVERLTKQTQIAAEEAKKAKEAFDAVVSAREEYDALTSDLEELTEGTQEWKDKLGEVNSEVNKLIEEFPELISYVKTLSNGQMEISEGGWDKVIGSAERAHKATLGRENISNARLEQAEAELNIDKFKNGIGANNLFGIGAIGNADIRREAIEAFESGTSFQDMASIQKLPEEEQEKIISELTAVYNKYNSVLLESKKNLESYSSAMLYSSASEEVQNSKYAVGISQLQGKSVADDIENSIDLNKERLLGYYGSSEVMAREEAYRKELEKQYGIEDIGLYNQPNHNDYLEQNRTEDYNNLMTNLGNAQATYEANIESLRGEWAQELRSGTFQQIAQLASEYSGQSVVYDDTASDEEFYKAAYTAITGIKEEEMSKDLKGEALQEAVLELAYNIEQGMNYEKLVTGFDQARERERARGIEDDDKSSVDALYRLLTSPETMSGSQAGLFRSEQVDINKIASDMGLTLEELANTLGYHIEDFDDLLAENIKLAGKQFAKSRVDMAKQITQYQKKNQKGLTFDVGNEENFAQQILALEDKFNYQFNDLFTGIMDSISLTGNDKLIDIGYNAIMTAAEFDPDVLKGVNEFVQSINWNNPIQGFKQLSREAERGSGATQQLAQDMLEVGDATFGAANQFKYLMQSEEFNALQETIDETIDSAEELNSTDINNLRTECKLLDQMLDNIGLSAAGAAKAITLLNKGKIGMHQLTDTVLAALKGFDSLDTVIYDAMEAINNFDPGINENDFAGFMQTAYETVNGNLEKGAVGNNQNRSYLEFLYGSHALQQQVMDESGNPTGEWEYLSGDAYVERQQHLAQKMKENQEDMFASWRDIAQGKDIYDNEIASSIGTSTKDGSATTFSFDGSSEFAGLTLTYDETADNWIEMEGYAGKTSDEIVKAFQTAYGVSEQYAKMMLGDLKNYSADIAQELSNNDLTAGLTNALEKAKEWFRVEYGSDNAYLAGSMAFFDESELEAMALAYGVTVDAIKAKLSEISGPNGYIVTDLYDEEGLMLQGQALYDELNRIYTELGAITPDSFLDTFGKIPGVAAEAGEEAGASFMSSYMKQIKNADGTLTWEFDYDSFVADMGEKFNMTEAQASEIAGEWLTKLDAALAEGESINIVSKLLGTEGSLNSDDVIATGSLSSAINAELESIKMDTFSAKLATAFSEITFTLNEEEIDMSALQTSANTATSDGVHEGAKAGSDATTAEDLSAIGDSAETTTEAGIKQGVADVNASNPTISLSANTSKITSAINTITSGSYSITIKANVDKSGLPAEAETKGYKGSIGNSGRSFASRAKGQKAFRGYRKGLLSAKGLFDALVGEEGPELIWKKKEGRAYLAGVNGPEITKLHHGDTVYTAEETKEIFNDNSGIDLGSFAGGYNKDYGWRGDSSSGSGSSSSDDFSEAVDDFSDSVDEMPEPWENPYDKFYNLIEKIEKNMHDRVRMEHELAHLTREQNDILNVLEYNTNIAAQKANIQRQADNLRDEYALNKTLKEGKEREIQDYMADNSRMRYYGYYDAASEQVYINWDAIEAESDQEYGEEIEKYISGLEELSDAIWDAEEAMYDAEEAFWDLEDQLQEMIDELKQAYLDFEGRVLEALVASYQMEIDELQELADLYFETNSQIISGIQDIINEQRSQREMDKAKEDLDEQQRRLAFLKQDTSGANALEIMALEEQIREAQQSYTDSLIDKAIEEMTTSNDLAETQRQQQIDLMQHQLEYAQKTGMLWDEVNNLLHTAIDANGNLVNNSALLQLLQKTEGWQGMSEFAKMQWVNDINSTIIEAMAGLREWTSNSISSLGSILGGNGSYSNGSFSGYSRPALGSGGSGSGGFSSSGSGEPDYLALVGSYAKPKANMSEEDVINLQKGLNQQGFNVKVDGKYGSETMAAVKQMQERTGTKVDGYWGTNSVASYQNYKGYSTGGLVDYTGPAVVHGSPSRPELVLNAQDTQNFIQLKDILKDTLKTASNGQSSGNTYYEIHIEVDELASDYDIEQVADKVKRLINEDARYRNNNIINLLR